MSASRTGVELIIVTLALDAWGARKVARVHARGPGSRAFGLCGLGSPTAAQRLDVANQLPALGFGQLRPDGHAAADHAVGQQPEQRSRSGLLHLGGAQAGALLAPPSRRRSVALGAMLFEEFAPAATASGSVFSGLRRAAAFRWGLGQFRIDRRCPCWRTRSSRVCAECDTRR